MRIRISVVIEGEDGHEETIEEVGCRETEGASRFAQESHKRPF
jgi:hypothetical protein